MLIGIDASRATVPRPAGTAVYSQRLIAALLRQGSAHRFRLYFRDSPPPEMFAGAEVRVIPFPRLWTHVRLSWEMRSRPPDVLFVPAHVIPLIHPRASVVTVHDLGYLHFPNAHPRLQRLYLDLSTRWSVQQAAHVLADSAATRADLVAHYGVPPEKITVAYPGYDPGLTPVRDRAVIEAVKARYGVSGDYFLFLGTLQPRKNIVRLAAAFASLRRRWPTVAQPPSLVLAGSPGWLYEEIAPAVGEGIVLTGYISEEEKRALLSGALAFVFPSLYEGFGLPVLEAQACGCPVITSDGSSLPEVAGEGAFLVPPHDTAAIAEAMARLAAEPGLRESLVERGFDNLRRFSWESCARTVLRVCEGLR